MKRNIKNILMISIIILMIIGSYLTITNLKNNKMMDNTPKEIMQNSDNPSKMPHGSGNEKAGDIKFSKKERSSKEKRMGDENTNSDLNQPTFDKKNTPPEMPNGENKENSIPIIYYVIFGVNSLVISITLMYLIMSNFNKKNFKETFQDSIKIIITILISIMLTGLLTYLSVMLANNYFVNNTSNSIDNPNGNNSNVTYSSNKEITTNEDITNETFTSSEKDNNAISVNGDITSNLSNITVNKTGDSNGGDSTSFYGTNSAVLARGGATLTITDATILTNATGANGVFSYGGSATTNNTESDGTTVNITDSKIETTKDNSGGIMTTGGGIMNATNLTITTSGTSSAAIRTDRGGGTVTVNKGVYTTNGQGSPSIYSTANITVNDATLVSNSSEGVVIEGANSVTLNNCELIDTNNKLNGQSTTYKNIFLYQSMSGDASSGNATFTATNSKLTTNKGDSFYVTNTTATINLTNNTIINNDATGNFLRIQKDSWGNSGSNGGDVTLNLTNQKVEGNIVVDSISSLKMTMKDNSYFKGVINKDNTSSDITLTLDSSSTIYLTGDSYVTSFINGDSSNSNISFNGYKLYVNGKAIN